MGRPVGVAIDKRGALLVADDVGNSVWRVASSTPAPGRPHHRVDLIAVDDRDVRAALALDRDRLAGEVDVLDAGARRDTDGVGAGGRIDGGLDGGKVRRHVQDGSSRRARQTTDHEPRRERDTAPWHGPAF
jgi:hypothetical protein